MKKVDYFNSGLDAKMAYADAATAHANSGAIILVLITVGAVVAMFLYFHDKSRKFESEQLSNMKETMAATNAKKDLEIATLRNKLQEGVVIPEPVVDTADAAIDETQWAQPVSPAAPVAVPVVAPVAPVAPVHMAHQSTVDEDELTAQYLLEAELERCNFDPSKY